MTLSSPSQTRHTREPEWTPRQRQVLDLLVRGLTNTQIAQHLGISLDGAKWHVSEIITRLGVDSRDEAAEYWRRHNGLKLRFTRQVSALFGWTALKWGAASVVIGGLAAVTAMVVYVLHESGTDNDRSAADPPAVDTAQTNPTVPSAQVTPAPQPQLTGETVAGVAVQKLSFTSPGTFPVPMSVIIEKGCWGCDGPAAAFDRVRMEGSGKLVTEQLFRPASGYISSSYFDPAGKTHYLTVCSRGYCGGVGQISADAQTTVYRSTDGGVTWQSLETLDGAASVVANTAQGPLLDLDFGKSFRILGTSTSIQPPAGMNGAYVAGRFAGWRSSDGKIIYEVDGKTPLLTLPDLGVDPASVQVEAIRPNGDFVVSFPSSTANQMNYAFVRQGKVASVVQSPGRLMIGAWLSDTIALGNTYPVRPDGTVSDAALYPAIFDFAAGQIEILELYGPVGDDAYIGQRNYVRFASALRSFVVKSTGDCLNVREAPSTCAKSLGCFADGVLLGDAAGSNGEQEASGITWWKVSTPAGDVGWASSEFLEGAQLRP
jgi:DNA-binding CsgD family transcriptional regulator